MNFFNFHFFALCCALLFFVDSSVGLATYSRCSDDFIGLFLERSNTLRAQHGVPPLRWSPPIAYWAQDWADEVIHSGRFHHRPDNLFGENMYYYRSDGVPARRSHPNGAAPVDAWYTELEDYHWFGEEPPPESMEKYSEWGSFTQLVWKDTVHVGVGCAAMGEHFVVVADYDPPGNMPGRFQGEVYGMRA